MKLLTVCWTSLVFAWGLASAQPVVVTSIFPYQSLVAQVAGEKATVVNLLPAGASPHTFDPSPRDVARVTGADLVVLNGGLDAWLRELVRASGSGARVLEALSSVAFEPVGLSEADAGGVNPHIWLEPGLMMGFVPKIASALADIDPANADAYRENADALVSELRALDAELAAQLAPVRGAPFVPFHDAWPYFAARYGLNLVVEIEPAPGREPSPRYVADALELIGASGALAIFSERQLPARPAEVVAENAGLPLFILDPLGGARDTDSYQAMLRYNAGVIAGALTPAAR